MTGSCALGGLNGTTGRSGFTRTEYLMIINWIIGAARVLSPPIQVQPDIAEFVHMHIYGICVVFLAQPDDCFINFIIVAY